MTKRVFVGMSGGVDSSLTAALLVEQGYSVTGVFMKNWTQDVAGFICPWQQDYEDAKRVAVDLGIELKVYDFETEYRQKVVDYLVDGYKKGLTPNPDIICNQEIKFKLFLDTALDDGAELIATGHYAIVKDGQLFKAKDENKDQTYFLYRIETSALDKCLMPIGRITKPQVRVEAKKRNLVTADKKDSQGICFIGEVGIKDFLLNELGPQKPGDIIDQNGKVIGRHDGAIFYTIGQRHGLDIGGGLPYYVTSKNIPKNQLLVTTNIDDRNLWQQTLKLNQFHWTCPKKDLPKGQLTAVCRYRSKPIKCSLSVNKRESSVKLDQPARAITPGQSVVIYNDQLVVGGGIIV